ncbi:MAG: 1-acyl-sn-glycerol-3-phosphate acyltransferase [Firmicutes bacterium]|nr:1-acyl-sn-glycerol-3-phosphate acyltransferase [Bacillota bacterium]
MFYGFVRTLLVIVVKLFYRYRIIGLENIPRKGPVIIAANHQSYLDPIMVALAVKGRQVNFMGKASLFKIPVLGTIIKWLNTFPVKRGTADKAAIAHSLKLLNSGEVLLIFPEGTRIRNGSLGKPYPGVTAMALKTGAPIVPLGIIGTDKVVPNGSKVPRFPKITVRVGKPINVEKTLAKGRKEKEEELTLKMMEEISKLVNGG